MIDYEIGNTSMNERYKNWIIENVPGDGYGMCAEATEAMAEAFPELQRVRGHYYCMVWGEREHWWLKTADGSIVDPTAAQFPTKGTGKYVPWTEGEREPTGMCPECGGYCYDGDTFCSENCGISYVAYCNSFCR
jgi:hypothetical protein